MSATVLTHDFKRLNLAIAVLAKLTQKDATSIVREEAKRFVELAQRITPPRTKKIGATAIKREMRRLFTPVNSKFAKQVQRRYGSQNVNGYWRIKGEKTKLEWQVIDPKGEHLQDTYNRYRSKATGKLKSPRNSFKIGGRWTARHVTTKTALNRFMATKIKRVGYLRAGWLKSNAYLGGRKMPKWVRQHGSKMAMLGAIRVVGFGTPKFSLTLINKAPGNPKLRKLIPDVARIRTERMIRRMKGIQRWYAKELAAGRTPKPIGNVGDLNAIF